MVTQIIEFERPKLKDPLFIQGLPGIGNVGRIAAGYLTEEIGAKKFAELISSHFMPFVLLHETSETHLLKYEFFYWRAKKRGQRDLIIMVGDMQSITPEGHYEIAEEILKYLKGIGVKEIITLGGLNVGEIIIAPKVIGASSDLELIKKYKGYGIEFVAGTRAGTIVGAAGLLLGLAKYHGMRGICLLGETVGLPIIPDPRSAEAVLKVLLKFLDLKIDLSKLKKRVEEMEKFIKKVEDVQKRALVQMARVKPPPEEEKLTYIG
ncbi:MAG: proteasome assembly chaperone family protein [Candidatus Aenigmarchaeota archaeon]|nr:proteasome assembly chaperone family protein [Candidatus Aenigmarchaeota archaeon]